MKLLLAGVFKPYGVNDQWGEALCTMELLNNQVTREQGIHSPRSNNPSFGLYLMAENVDVETTVLDFPSWEDFAKEVKTGGYTHIGISFIVPNVNKVQRMARFIRDFDPEIKIMLGGHGTSIPNLNELVEYDSVCRGEGVAWLRRYFGEDPEKPIKHPVVHSSMHQFVYGAPIIKRAGIILTGVGCQNACNFCATSHKFETRYVPFMRTGKEVFDAVEKTGKELKVTEFAIMDENFCKMPVRARQLLTELENNKKAYTFATFSSAETIKKLGIDFLIRLGINFIWIGVESKADVFEKTKGIDVGELIKELKENGITVLASAILFMDHHDKETIMEDIEWAISLESDLLQFMQFGPIPGTGLYKDYDSRDKLLKDIPWVKQHGQDQIWFHHPHFTLQETHDYLKMAFTKKFETHGPGVLNMAHTAVTGYLTQLRKLKEREEQGLVWNPETLAYEKHPNPQTDEYMRLRLEAIREYALQFRPIFKAAKQWAPNKKAAEKAQLTYDLYNEAFGKPTMKDKVMSGAVQCLAVTEHYRAKRAYRGVVMRQPDTIKRTYPNRAGEKPSTVFPFTMEPKLKNASAGAGITDAAASTDILSDD